MKTINPKLIKKIFLTLSFICLASTSHAMCLKECGTSGTRHPLITPTIQYQDSHAQTQQNQHSFNRENSHDLTRSKNAIGGDVNIKVGHEKMEFSNGANGLVNASITSIVNLGDTVNNGDTHN